jgi:hypothetical protein
MFETNTHAVETESGTSVETPITSVPMSKREKEHHDMVMAVRNAATSEDVSAAMRIARGSEDFSKETITAKIASVIYVDHNAINRSFNITKSIAYRDAILRGEWKYHHQGIAFYADGTLADGQHRMSALALSGMTLEFAVAHNFDRGAIDAIDRASRRTAGQSLEMMGVKNGQKKASVAKTVMEYAFEADNKTKGRFTDPQIESWVTVNEDLIESAIRIGMASYKNADEPAMSEVEATTASALLLYGNWQAAIVEGYVNSVMNAYGANDDPQYSIGTQLRKNKSEADKKVLGRQARLALVVKGAHLARDHVKLAKVTWNPKKNPLPSYRVDALVSA